MLEEINFPFLMHFYQTMKDDLNIYFLVEYIKGMELFDVIRDIGKTMIINLFLINFLSNYFYFNIYILCFIFFKRFAKNLRFTILHKSFNPIN